MKTKNEYSFDVSVRWFKVISEYDKEGIGKWSAPKYWLMREILELGSRWDDSFTVSHEDLIIHTHLKRTTIYKYLKELHTEEWIDYEEGKYKGRVSRITIKRGKLTELFRRYQKQIGRDGLLDSVERSPDEHSKALKRSPDGRERSSDAQLIEVLDKSIIRGASVEDKSSPSSPITDKTAQSTNGNDVTGKVERESPLEDGLTGTAVNILAPSQVKELWREVRGDYKVKFTDDKVFESIARQVKADFEFGLRGIDDLRRAFERYLNDAGQKKYGYQLQHLDLHFKRYYDGADVTEIRQAIAEKQKREKKQKAEVAI